METSQLCKKLGAKHCGIDMLRNIQNKITFSQEQAAENKHSILKEDEVPDAKLLKEPEKCAVEGLKRWLQYHGLKKSGKKAELIKRVKDGLKLNLPVDPKIDGGKWYNLKTEDSASIENTSSKTSITSLGEKNLPANLSWTCLFLSCGVCSQSK